MTKTTLRPRRVFLKNLSATTLLAGTMTQTSCATRKPLSVSAPKATSPNDHIQVAAIGMGIMGFNNCKTMLQLPGVQLLTVCDLYDGRLKRAQELFGDEVAVTKDYRSILADSKIDAVIVSTTDHWHAKIAMEAMTQGKAVYCEKPMVHKLTEGLPMIKVQAETGRVCQIGSQRVSSAVYLKAKELYESGAIGSLILAEAFWDRQSALGAWQYSIPRDASPQTVDWATFLGNAPVVDFDPVRFFRWRNYRDYGTGIAGDLFVHLFSGLHIITGSLGPMRIYTSGGLRHWKDGRDVPDVLVGVYDYPETQRHPAFNLQVRVNFVDGGGGGQEISLSGTEGKMIIGDTSVKVLRNKMGKAPGFGGWDTYDTFDEQNQQDFSAWYEENYRGVSDRTESTTEEFHAPEGYNDHLDHHAKFLDAVRLKETTVVEDPAFGFRAAAVALASNQSFFESTIVKWDPESMQLT